MKVCNDEGDGLRFDSLIKEFDLLKRMKGGAHVCQCIDFFEDVEGLFLGYLVMKHAGSTDLHGFIQEEKNMTKSNLVDLSWQLLLALEHVHRNQICHRDVKPDNIIIRSHG